MSPIRPKNLTAQLLHRGAGNPPQTHPTTAVGNFFPGLEFNFLNVWKRLFVGIELLETGAEVLRVDPDQPTNIQALRGGFLIAVDGRPTIAPIVGPKSVGGPDVQLGTVALEWTNVLSEVHAAKGGTDQRADCTFQLAAPGTDGQLQIATIPFAVRRLIDADTALISRAANLPGELTESLCSPWQTDYIGCACYYWASNRPDYVNVERAGQGSLGHNWLNPSRVNAADGTPRYTLRPENTLRHEDILQGWEHKFQFVIGGKDTDGAVPPDDTGSTS
jgi:hypothetical protein